MANSKKILIPINDSGCHYWIKRRGGSPYIHLWWRIKTNGKWEGSKKSLYTPDWEEAYDRAISWIKGNSIKSIKGKSNSKRRTLEEWKDEFLLKYTKETTKRDYEKDIDRFIDFMSKNYPDIKYIHLIDYEHVSSFEAHERNRLNEKFPEKKLSENTIKGELKSISSWLGEARRRRYTHEKHFEDFPVGAITPRKEVFYPEEIVKILDNLKDPLYKAVILLLLQRGLRISEIISAKRAHLKDEGKILEIPNTKEGFPKRIYLPTLSRKAIKKLPEKNIYLFPNPHDSNCPEWVKLDRDIEQFCKKLGIKGNPHKFRHTFCCYSLKCGANPMDVARMMGHRRLTTTQNYYQIIDVRVDGKLKRVFGEWD